ncbi:hypothetical protein GN956_G12940 [Arapaima gigas]
MQRYLRTFLRGPDPGSNPRPNAGIRLSGITLGSSKIQRRTGVKAAVTRGTGKAASHRGTFVRTSEMAECDSDARRNHKFSHLF